MGLPSSSATGLFLSPLFKFIMQIIDNKALLFNTRKAPQITSIIPKSKILGSNGDVDQVLVNWGFDEVQLLRNLGIREVPSPILGRYEWPGMFTPFDHQRTTAEFLTLHPRCFVFNEAGTGKTSAAAWAADYPYLGGNCSVKNINGQDSVGPALTKNVDVGNDFNLIPAGFNFYDKVTGRLYILTTFVTNQARVLLYNVDRQTLEATAVGQISVLMPATPTFKEIQVVGSGTTGLKIFIDTTNTVTATGGPLLVNNVAISDFGMVGFTTFPFAFNQTNAAAVYRLTTSVQPGGLNTSGSGAVNVAASVGMFHQSNSIKVFNGLSAAARVLHFQSNASPVHTSAAVTFTIASPGKVNYTAHPFNLNDTVVLSSS